jgi:hypothetical protein
MSRVNVRKCDRCDSLYELYFITYPNIELVATKSKNKDITITASIDLCDKCYAELKTWFGREVSFE